MPFNNKLRNNYFSIILIASLIFFVLLRFPSLFESFWYGDEGIYAAVAEEMSKGKALYAETWDHKPPFIFWVFYPAALIGWNSGFVLLRALNIILGAASIYFVFQILKNTVNRVSLLTALSGFSLFLGAPHVEGNILNAEVIFMPLNLASLYLLIVRKHYKLVGFLAFLSLITKVPGFVEFAIFGMANFVVYLKERQVKFFFQVLFKLAVGFLIPLGILLLYFVLKGTFTDFIYANAIFNRIYSLHQGNITTIGETQIPNTFLGLFSLISIFLLTSALYLKNKMALFLFLAINVFVAEFFASLLSGKNYAHYFLQMLPGSAILLAAVIHEGKKLIKPYAIASSILVIALILPMIYTLTKGGKIAIFAKPGEYYSSFVKGYIYNEQVEREKFWWGNGGAIEAVKNFAQYYNAELINTQAYIYTDKAWLLALIEGSVTNKYVVWFHLAYTPKHLNEDLENMKRAEVFVLDKDTPVLPEVEKILSEQFIQTGQFENFAIYSKTI